MTEQEPLSNFRRDMAAEDEFRLRVEAETAEVVHRGHIRVAWMARRLRLAGWPTPPTTERTEQPTATG